MASSLLFLSVGLSLSLVAFITEVRSRVKYVKKHFKGKLKQTGVERIVLATHHQRGMDIL